MKDENNTNCQYLIILPIFILVKGYTRTAIYDIQRGLIDFIPNDMQQFCIICNKLEMGRIKKLYTEEYSDTIDEYIDFLMKNQYAMIGSKEDLEGISNLNWQWDHYSDITNCVIHYSDIINKEFNEILEKVNISLNCTVFELLFDNFLSIKDLESILKKFREYNVKHLGLIVPYNTNLNMERAIQLLRNNLIINKLIITNAPFNETKNFGHTILIYTVYSVNDKSCGCISPNYFSLNIEHVTESQNYNTCLNRKLSIDKNGNIKSCPFSKKTYGNILTASINNIINGDDFKKQWNIRKDQVKVCKDCEFRHICTDCRVFIKDEHDIYSQPAKCTYNPYIGKWENEEGFCSVEESLNKTE